MSQNRYFIRYINGPPLANVAWNVQARDINDNTVASQSGLTPLVNNLWYELTNSQSLANEPFFNINAYFEVNPLVYSSESICNSGLIVTTTSEPTLSLQSGSNSLVIHATASGIYSSPEWIYLSSPLTMITQSRVRFISSSFEEESEQTINIQETFETSSFYWSVVSGSNTSSITLYSQSQTGTTESIQVSASIFGEYIFKVVEVTNYSFYPSSSIETTNSLNLELVFSQPGEYSYGLFIFDDICGYNVSSSVDIKVPIFNPYATFDYSIGTDGIIYDIKVYQDSGEIYVVGNFNHYNSESYQGIVKINYDGNPDSNFVSNPGFSSLSYGIPSQVELMQDNTDDGVFVGTSYFNGGIWSSSFGYSGSINQHIFYIERNGLSKYTFPEPLNVHKNTLINFLNVGGNKVILSTDSSIRFVDYSLNDYLPQINAPSQSNGLYRLNTDYVISTGDTSGFINAPTGACIFNIINGNLLQSFTGFPGSDGNGVWKAASDATGSNIYFQIQNNLCASSSVYGNTWNGSSVGGLIRVKLNGALDTSFKLNSSSLLDGSGCPNPPWLSILKVLMDGRILVACPLSWTGVTINNVSITPGQPYLLTSDGYLDLTFDGQHFNGYVLCADQQSDGKLLFGGSFDSYNGYSVNNICRLWLNGQIDLI